MMASRLGQSGAMTAAKAARSAHRDLLERSGCSSAKPVSVLLMLVPCCAPALAGLHDDKHFA
jgi:hypothetical protein